jgi:hypothetical protein
MISALETRLATKSVAQLKKKVARIIDKVPDPEIPTWDTIPADGPENGTKL